MDLPSSEFRYHRCNSRIWVTLFLLLLGSHRSIHANAAFLPFFSRQSETNEVNIAYFLQVSEENLILLPRLLRVLWHEENVYVIHFDKKISEWEREHVRLSLFRKGSRYSENVIVIDSEPVTYRGISMVLNNLNAMQAAMDAQVDWTFFINLSGSDYPLLSPQEQRRLLAADDFAKRNRSFFSVSNSTWWSRSKEFRYDRLFVDTSLAFNDSTAEIIDTFTEQPLSNLLNFTFVAAEAWMILHRRFVDHLLRNGRSRRMLLTFSTSVEAEEHYFTTVAYNEPLFNQSVVPHALRHVVWRHKGVHSGQHPYYVDAKNETDGSWVFKDSIANSGCFFTRKILNANSPLLDWIDTHVSGVSTTSVVEDDVKRFQEKASNFISCIGGLTGNPEADPCLQ